MLPKWSRLRHSKHVGLKNYIKNNVKGSLPRQRNDIYFRSDTKDRRRPLRHKSTNLLLPSSSPLSPHSPAHMTVKPFHSLPSGRVSPMPSPIPHSCFDCTAKKRRRDGDGRGGSRGEEDLPIIISLRWGLLPKSDDKMMAWVPRRRWRR